MVEILEKIKSHFGTVDKPYYGPTYILPDGSLLNLDGKGHHSTVEHWLIENNLSENEYIKTGGSPTIEALGCIRCDMVKYYIGLSEEQPTREQYNSLLVWLDQHSRFTKIITVISPGGEQSTDYRFTSDFISDDVVDRIRRYYVCGKLYEQLDTSVQFRRQHNFKYKREILGESLKEGVMSKLEENIERYKIVKYGQWHWGILDTTLNNGKGLMLRKGSEADPYKPISENNKLLLFKSKDEAQKYADDLAEEDALIESFLNKVPNAVEARWDEKRKAYIVSKEEYDRWDD